VRDPRGLVIALALVVLALASAPRAAVAPTMRVGSKAFTEGVILGELVTQVGLAAGAAAEHHAQMGGTRILWTALTSGQIDLYVEYTGTLREELLAGEAIPRGDLTALRAALARRGLGLIGPLGFANTYGLGMTEARAAALGITTISDLTAHPALVLGFSSEFLDRADGWPGLAARYRLPQRDVRGMDHDLAYRALVDGAIDVVDVYTTDAEIERYRLRVLRDDRAYFPPYDAVIVYREDWARTAPAAVAALQHLTGAIAQADMIAMNARVRLDGRSEAEVASALLRDRLALDVTRHQPTRITRIWTRTQEHVRLVAAALALALAIALPLGVLAARVRGAGHAILAVVGVVQTIPSLAFLVLMIPLFGIGGPPAVVAMAAYSLLPVVRNTHAGLTAIPAPLLESADVLGLSAWARLWRVELPLAAPTILAGIQTAAVLSVGTATIGALVGAGGYGQPILTGVRLDDLALILEGAVPAAAFAVLVQGGFGLLGRMLVPRGLRLGPSA